MKIFYTLVIVSSLLLGACSSSKEEIKLGSLDQKPCRSEKQLNSADEFTGETADNLVLFQQGNLVYASMDIRTYCNAKISFDIQKEGDRIKLRVKNNNIATDKCVCFTNVTTSIENLQPGSYTVLVTNAAGNQLLTQRSLQVKE
jgi:major membrane immunogen (membrane-anchored lipoprotein)